MAHMKYNPWEKCPKCGGASPKRQLIDPETLRLTCHDCGYMMLRATLDSDGRENIIDVLKRETGKTRERLIRRTAEVITSIRVKGITAATLRQLADYVTTQLEGPGGVTDLNLQHEQEQRQ